MLFLASDKGKSFGGKSPDPCRRHEEVRKVPDVFVYVLVGIAIHCANKLIDMLAERMKKGPNRPK